VHWNRILSNLKRPTSGGRDAYPEEIEESVAVALAMIAGFVDAYGFIVYNIYVSFMSGNTTRAGFETGEGNFSAAAHSALPIICFLGGSFAGALLAHSSVRPIRRLVFAVIAASLALIIGFTQLGLLSDWANLAVISFTMGAMNTALSGVGARSRVAGQTISLTFVSGTLSRIGMELALAVRRAHLTDSQGPWDTHARRALRLAIIWAGFLSGALLSGAATPRFGVWALSFPVLFLSALAALDRSSSAPAGRIAEFEEILEAVEPESI
jgi:uncharacterized membrane protein YoaK (UPF0700 family)